MSQAELDFSARAERTAELLEREREAASEASLSERFEAFHRENPRVLEVFVQLAREARAVGHQSVGIGMLWEVMRWRLGIQTNDPVGWRLNNSFRSRYARLIMSTCPDLAGVFETRELKTK